MDLHARRRLARVPTLTSTPTASNMAVPVLGPDGRGDGRDVSGLRYEIACLKKVATPAPFVIEMFWILSSYHLSGDAHLCVIVGRGVEAVHDILGRIETVDAYLARLQHPPLKRRKVFQAPAGFFFFVS